MEIKGVLLKITDVEFALIEVSQDIISSDTKALEYIKKHAFFFPRVPIVLMTYDENKKPIYYGKKEITRLLVNIHPSQIRWKRYMVKKGR